MRTRIPKAAVLGLVAVIVLACGGVKIPTIPPVVIPTLGPGSSGAVDPGTGLCRLLTVAEVGAVMGAAVSITESKSDSCTYTSGSTFATVNVRLESDNDLSTARFLMGSTAKDITVGSYPGLSGVFVGGPLVYAQRGSEQLVLQGILTGSDDAAVAKIVQLANTAAPRW